MSLSMQVRVDALHTLGHYAPSDLLASEFWPDLKKMLQEALEDPDQLLCVRKAVL